MAYLRRSQPSCSTVPILTLLLLVHLAAVSVRSASAAVATAKPPATRKPLVAKAAIDSPPAASPPATSPSPPSPLVPRIPSRQPPSPSPPSPKPLKRSPPPKPPVPAPPASPSPAVPKAPSPSPVVLPKPTGSPPLPKPPTASPPSLGGGFTWVPSPRPPPSKASPRPAKSPPPPPPSPQSVFLPYRSEYYGDEILVLTVQPSRQPPAPPPSPPSPAPPSPGRAPPTRPAPPSPPRPGRPDSPSGLSLGSFDGSGERRLFFALQYDMSAARLSDGTSPYTYRRVELTEDVDPDVYGAFESGDMVTFKGWARSADTSAMKRKAATAAASGRRLRLSETVDQADPEHERGQQQQPLRLQREADGHQEASAQQEALHTEQDWAPGSGLDGREDAAPRAQARLHTWTEEAAETRQRSAAGVRAGRGAADRPGRMPGGGLGQERALPSQRHQQPQEQEQEQQQEDGLHGRELPARRRHRELLRADSEPQAGAQLHAAAHQRPHVGPRLRAHRWLQAQARVGDAPRRALSSSAGPAGDTWRQQDGDAQDIQYTSAVGHESGPWSRRHLQNGGSPGSPPDLVSGPDEEPDSDYVLASSADRGTHAFFVDRNLEAEIAPTKPLTSVTLILNVCNRTNPVTKKALDAYWFGNGSARVEPTLKSFFERCSHGINPFDRDKNLIVGPIDVPCAATPSTGRPFDSARCTDRELFGWAQWAMERVLNTTNVTLGMRVPRRRIFLLPDMPACAGWESLASVGCGRTCPVFLKLANGTSARQVASQLMHDLGHTLSLGHSAALPGALGDDAAGGPQADGSCPMGGAVEGSAGLVCPNAVNGWKNGWTRPLSGTGYGGLFPRFTGSLVLPPTSARPDSVARVIVSAAQKPADDPTAGRNSTYYISYRAANSSSGYDAGLNATGLGGQVYVHHYDGLTARLGTPYVPLLVGSSAALRRDPVPGTDLREIPLADWAARYFRLYLQKADAGGATVHACVSAWGPMPATEGRNGTDCEQCSDGRDNDCNGLTDDQDPACAPCFEYYYP